MKQNNYTVKDGHAEKIKQPLYDFQQVHFQVILNVQQPQNPKQQNQNYQLKEKQTAIKPVSTLSNQQAIIYNKKTNQNLLLKFIQTTKTPLQPLLSKKEQPRINVITKNNQINCLPKVNDNQKKEGDYRKHISEAILMQKYHSTRLIEYQNQKTFSILNKLTNNKFNKSRYCNLNFLQQINKQQKFVIFVIQKLELFGVKHTSSFLGKNPPTYQCSFFSDQKLLYRSKPVEYNEFLESIIGFNCQEFTSIYVVIEKIKQNEEVIDFLFNNQFQVGEVIYIESYSHITTTPLKDNIMIKVSDEIEGDIKKTISDEQVTVGKLQYKVLQLCQSNNQYKLQAPQSIYAIQIQQSTPRPSARQIDQNTPTQLK
ncbi:unnamed protein product (macronuclear) [Paramecium tetraurelia]|uniref:Uncharacterized protein n=1 Tax=Paramecium tetraurelia TaxID=5888 RepID=A0DN39_PARTE|nr:uncharacterized protein GSPATT00018661001 [Paramecium tetraurelia]CAK84456.1 unnamed protein product [Paramecium tetraurelia]|eukprot:XP_001451853.1 hypothetical protein (macronuclear) [Paramecium tetraurelia strain d4-2]